MAQRLVRKICQECRVEYSPKQGELKKAGVDWGGRKLYRGKGCPSCSGSGYSGRVGIFEVMSVNGKIRNLIANDAPERELVRVASEAGMVPLHLDGLKKVSSGLTTLEELTRVVYMSKEDLHGDCPSCGQPLPASAAECPHCGERTERRVCPSCSKERRPEWIACPYCAVRFD